MAAEDLILGMIAGGCGSLVLWITIGRKMMLKYAGVSVARAIANPDEEMQEALDGLMLHLWTWLNTASLEVDGPLGEDDKPTKVKISPLQNVLGSLIDTISQKIYNRFMGAKGAAIKDANRAAAEAFGLPPGPRKGQSTGDFYVEQIIGRLMPKIDEKLNTWLENLNKQGGMQ